MPPSRTTRRPVSMADIAREADVSKNTVSLALQHDPQIPNPTRARIIKIARKLGYRKNPVVAHLMAELRRERAPRFKATLALLNANPDPRAFTRHPTIPAYVEGCRRRARELGYALDDFWLHDPAWTAPSLERILKTRNTRGAVVIGTMHDNHLPEKFAGLWHHLPCVVTGVRPRNPALSFASVDHHALALRAYEQALALGYKRPALVIDSAIDRLVDHRFSAGFLIARQHSPRSSRTRPFLLDNNSPDNLPAFESWLENQRPDVILTLYNQVKRWVESLGLSVPRDIGLIQLEWRRTHPEWAGMNQHNDLVGEAAIDILIGMIHRGESGPPPSPRATLITSTWVLGATVKVPTVGKPTV